MDDGTDMFAYDYTQFNQLSEIQKNSSVVDTYAYDLRGNQIVHNTDYTSGSPTTA